MKSKFSARSLGLALVLAGAALGSSMQSAHAGPVNLDTWYEFGFSAVGDPLGNCSGCSPTVPASTDAGDAPWTISLTGPATLTVLDLFLSVDQFRLSDNAVLLGDTSAPVAGGACGGDIACAFADPNYSRGVFLLGAGDHSLTGTHLAGVAGAAVFQITAVPEPGSLGLLGVALAGFGLFRRRKSRA